jgi:hypothetical protein
MSLIQANWFHVMWNYRKQMEPSHNYLQKRKDTLHVRNGHSPNRWHSPSQPLGKYSYMYRRRRHQPISASSPFHGTCCLQLLLSIARLIYFLHGCFWFLKWEFILKWLLGNTHVWHVCSACKGKFSKFLGASRSLKFWSVQCTLFMFMYQRRVSYMYL